MHILISPAKTMTSSSKFKAPAGTASSYSEEAIKLALQMAQLSPEVLGKQLKLSAKLTAECYQRFQNFHADEPHPLQALLAYTGVVFKNMNPSDFSSDDYLFAQEHLRIASPLYGLLRPLDLIKPYRLEFDTKLPEAEDQTISAFWRNIQTRPFIEEIKRDQNILINLGSKDIQPAFDWKTIDSETRIITPEFKLYKNGKLTTIVIYCKMARGQMCREIIKKQITDPEMLKTFCWEGFRYNEELSSSNNWIYLQS